MAAKLVILGLIGSLLASAFTGLSPEPLPGIALGSEPLLLVERTIAFFAAWLAIVVVIAQALRGHLPTEISGRGVKYANADSVEATKDRTEDAMQRMTREIDQLRWDLMALEHRSSRHSERID